MTENLYDALEKALTALESGVYPESVRSETPEVESELRTLVETAEIARSHAPGVEMKAASQRSRTRVLARAAQLRQAPRSRVSIFNRHPRLAYFLVLAAVLLVSFSGLTITSAQALPGDQLYPVKLAVEDLRLDLSVGIEDHRLLEDRYQSRRIDEVNRLLTLGRQEFVAFHGKVVRLERDEWDVGGIGVHVNPQTIFIGEILPGMDVEVEGKTQAGGYVLASEIHLQRFGFVGYVESITPESWLIAGRIVRVSDETRLNPDVEVGDWVIVSVHSDDSGNLFALVIDAATLPTPMPESDLMVPTPGSQRNEDVQDSSGQSDDDQEVDSQGDLDIEDDVDTQVTEGTDTDHDDDNTADHLEESDESNEDDNDEDDEGSDDEDDVQDEKDDD